MPGTLVRIGRKSPRYSAGASGFMSYVSMCGGPPGSQMKMTDVSGDGPPASAAVSFHGQHAGRAEAAERQGAELEEVATRDRAGAGRRHGGSERWGGQAGRAGSILDKAKRQRTFCQSAGGTKTASQRRPVPAGLRRF